jgi:hypothetical protein
MSYEEAIAIVNALMVGIENPDGDWQPAAQDVLAAKAERNRLEAIQPAWAFATIWRHDGDRPEFVLPPRTFVAMVEYLIGEPVWAEQRYGDE